MSSAAPNIQDTPVKRSVTVKAGVEKAFDVFTAGFDSWWPRSHHIGQSPMTQAIIEPHVGGRCYSTQADGTDCPWGQVTAWDPPKRLVIAWMISPQWQYEPNLEKASEVEIVFTPESDNTTRVDLEHRNFSRMDAGWHAMREGVGAEGGWGSLLQLFVVQAEKSA
jgi:uncharacterized protein YndB with AHSA1/START domain